MKKLENFSSLQIHILFSSVFLYLVFVLLLSCSNSDDNTKALSIQNVPNRSLDFSLWQLAAFFEEVQMGYILRTDDGKVIVIDGGGKLTAPILKRYLLQFGGEVDSWIITHPHSDHIDSFLEIARGNDIAVRQVIHAPLLNSWVKQNESMNYEKVALYNQTIDVLTPNVIAMQAGDTLMLAAGIQMEVLSGYNEEIVVNAINNSSLTFKITSRSKSILFLGDLGEEAGIKLLENSENSLLKSDYVQMAHHGQRGVNKNFYKAVNATYALWPTPEWLWNNQLEGKSIGSGTFKTLEVRSWMDEFGITKNYVSGLEGNLQID